MTPEADDDRTGRYRQRRRTRADIVAAATRLLKAGRTPSVADVAEAADVSRRTVYLHFPTHEQLLIDATVGMLGENAVEAALEAADPGGADVDRRVEAMVSTVSRLAQETLPLGRTLIRLTVDPGTETPVGVPRRGFRRIDWIEQAIQPLHERLTDEQFGRLLSGLAMVVGWEAHIVLQDLRALDSDAERSTALWAARALIAAALADSAAPGPDG